MARTYRYDPEQDAPIPFTPEIEAWMLTVRARVEKRNGPGDSRRDFGRDSTRGFRFKRAKPGPSGT